MVNPYFYFFKKQIFCFAMLFTLFVNGPTANAQFFTGSQMEFGKNRIKYDDFFWTYYAYDRYDVYFYTGGQNLANYVSQTAKKQIASIEKFFDYSIDNRFEFIIYNKQSDFKQSNIGLSGEDEYNTGGVTRIAGTKIILYYEGDHAKLESQIRDGIAQVVIDQMLYGGSLRQMVKNNTLLNLPEWYLKGLYSYLSTDWNSDIDNKVKDGILSGKFNNINRLTDKDAVTAGHAFWKHIANNYGESTVPNVLYMAKISRNIDNSTVFVLGLSLSALWNECLSSFINKYKDIDPASIIPQTKPVLNKPKQARVYRQLKVSPDGLNILYTTNELGQNKVWLYNIETDRHKRILKIGHKINRITDYSFPLVAWHPSGKLFSFITERRGYLVMQTYELASEEISERNITGFEKILDYSYSDDGKKIVMSAVKKGQTDIYVLKLGSTAYYQVTNDIYDDLTPRFVHDSKGIVFSSNRINDTVFFDAKRKYPEGQKHKDLFLFDNVSKSQILTRVTNTLDIDESYPADYDSTHISYLSDQNGIRNRFVASFDSVISFIDTITHYRTIVYSKPITNYQRNILEQDVNIKANKYSEVIFQNGKYKMFVTSITSLDTLSPVNLINTSYRDYKKRVEQMNQVEITKREKEISEIPSIENVVEVVNLPTVSENDSSDVDIDNYQFEDEKIEKDNPSNLTSNVSVNDSIIVKTSDVDEFKLAKKRNYNTSYSVDNVVSQAGNSFLNRSYQKYSGGNGPVYLNSGMSMFFKTSLSDLFEDYRITGGALINTGFEHNEFFLSYEDRINNLDKQLVIHRQAIKAPDGTAKVLTYDIRYSLKHPFSEVASVRGSISYRNDRTVFLSTNDLNLLRSDEYENWASLTFQYVFDNTLYKGLNLYNGMRAKAFGQYYRQVDKKKTNFFVLGTDVRHYQKIHRGFIWANRFAASTSFGDQKLIYYMGGVDNWIAAEFDNTTNIATDQNYAFQTLATNVRGFFQNARNGNSFAVINSELRLPLFQYFAQRPIRSDFAQNFQVISFGDIGTAWTGYSPYADDNSLNTTIVGTSKTPLIITLKTKHNPIVGGYGIGLRSRLFGYFVRLDRAWGVQDGIVLNPITYISISLDF